MVRVYYFGGRVFFIVYLFLFRFEKGVYIVVFSMCLKSSRYCGNVGGWIIC